MMVIGEILGGFGGFWLNSAVVIMFLGVGTLTVGIQGSKMVTMGVFGSKTVSIVEFSEVLLLLVLLT